MDLILPWKKEDGLTHSLTLYTSAYFTPERHKKNRDKIITLLRKERAVFTLREDNKKEGYLIFGSGLPKKFEDILLSRYHPPLYDFVPRGNRRVGLVQRLYRDMTYKGRYEIYEAVNQALTVLGPLALQPLFDAITTRTVDNPVPLHITRDTDSLAGILIHAFDLNEIDWLEIRKGGPRGNHNFYCIKGTTEVSDVNPVKAQQIEAVAQINQQKAPPALMAYICDTCGKARAVGKKCPQCHGEAPTRGAATGRVSFPPPRMLTKPDEVKHEIQYRIDELQSYVNQHMTGARVKVIFTYPETVEFSPT